jgi:3-hydroxypropanoate dehydrogenase
MLSNQCLETLFTKARSHNGWLKKEISDAQITKIYDLMKYGPTAANSCPVRITFVKSTKAKDRLKSHLNEGNVEKCITAPAVAIISYDVEFYEKLPYLFPHTDAKSWYQGNPEKIKSVGEMNATLQGAYFMMAARSIGLDCGPMGGFNNVSLDSEFFPDMLTKSIFLCGIGYGDHDKVFSRLPRLSFEDVCAII